MDVSDDRLPDVDIGPRLAAGRDTTIYALGDDRVVRRAPDERSFTYEAEAMEAIRATGFPVPVVHRVGPGEMVLDRVPGPTMLDDLASHPWRVDAHARALADLHRRLHAIEAPPGLRQFAASGTAVLHLDLHPANVILSPDGPVVIDWTNVAQGPAGADVALTWIVLATFEIDDAPVLRALATVLRKRLVRTFVDAAGRDDARRQLDAVGAHRSRDRNIRPAEMERLRALVARHAL